MNLVNLLVKQAVRHPRRIALICGGRSIRYAELLERSAALAQRLAAGGLRPSDTVLPILDVGISLYITLLALFRLGATAVFPEPASGLGGLRMAARAVTVRALVGDWRRHIIRQFLPELRSIAAAVSPYGTQTGGGPEPLELQPDAPALITFTSGSTGQPKGIVRSHGFLMEQYRQLSAVLQPQDDDIVLVSLPIFILCNLANGVTSVIPDCDLRQIGKADPRPLVIQIERHRVNRLVLPPALCGRLAESGATLPHIRQVFTGGGPVFPDLLRRLCGLAPNAKITAVYGSSEAEPIARVTLDEISPEDFLAMRRGAGLLAGTPVEGIGLRIDDDEIWVSGAHVVTGYLNPADDGKTKRAIAGKIWHRTGDAGRIDDRGRLWLLGRREARIGSLFPFAVEAAARCVRGVRNAALLNVGPAAVLAIEYDRTSSLLPQEWTKQWSENLRVVTVPRIPTDQRHNSKVDYGRLREILRGSSLADWKYASDKLKHGSRKSDCAAPNLRIP